MMKAGSRYFVRIDVRSGSEKADRPTLMKHLEYVRVMSLRGELYGGGFSDVTDEAGMIVFSASDLEIAKTICDNDPIIQSGLYSYRLHEWNILISS